MTWMHGHKGWRTNAPQMSTGAREGAPLHGNARYVSPVDFRPPGRYRSLTAILAGPTLVPLPAIRDAVPGSADVIMGATHHGRRKGYRHRLCDCGHPSTRRVWVGPGFWRLPRPAIRGLPFCMSIVGTAQRPIPQESEWRSPGSRGPRLRPGLRRRLPSRNQG